MFFQEKSSIAYTETHNEMIKKLKSYSGMPALIRNTDTLDNPHKDIDSLNTIGNKHRVPVNMACNVGTDNCTYQYCIA